MFLRIHRYKLCYLKKIPITAKSFITKSGGWKTQSCIVRALVHRFITVASFTTSITSRCEHAAAKELRKNRYREGLRSEISRAMKTIHYLRSRNARYSFEIFNKVTPSPRLSHSRRVVRNSRQEIEGIDSCWKQNRGGIMNSLLNRRSGWWSFRHERDNPRSRFSFRRSNLNSLHENIKI